MVDKIKADVCDMVQSCNDYELIDLIWRLLYKSIDREQSPYDKMTDEERGKWEWLRSKTKKH